MRGLIAAVVALFAALLIQLTIVNGLPLPGGGAPDLVLLGVIAVGMVGGPRCGIVAGFCAGLALDLAPPASQLVGQYALVFCLVGYGCGRLQFVLRKSAMLSLAVATAAAAVGEVLAAALTVALDTPDVTVATIRGVLPSSLLYDVALAPLFVSIAVGVAFLLGSRLGEPDDSPALEAGGSAAPVGLAALAPGAATARSQSGRTRKRWWSRGRAGKAAARKGVASGGWLAGDDGDQALQFGAVGWLDGTVSSRRARRRRARLEAMLTGATRRPGAVWVGTRPPGLLPAARVLTVPATGLSRLRPTGGVAGSALATSAGALFAGPPSAGSAFGGSVSTGTVSGGGVSALPRSRRVRLGLADEQRRLRRERARRTAGTAREFGAASMRQSWLGLDQHGVDMHGVRGPDVRKMAFGTGSLPGAGRAARRGVPKIAFGSGGLPGAGRAARRGVPKIAFGSGGLPGAGRAARRGVPKIAFGSGGLPGAGRAARRGVPKIAFGSGGLPGAGRAARRGVPKIAFGSGSLPGAGSPQRKVVPTIAFGTPQRVGGPGRARRGAPCIAFASGGMPSTRAVLRTVPSIAFGTGSLPSAGRTGPRRPSAPKFRPGSRSATGSWLADASALSLRRLRRARRPKRPSFSRSAPKHVAAVSRRPKTARQRPGPAGSRWLPWPRRAGGRSAVWLIGAGRIGEHR